MDRTVQIALLMDAYGGLLSEKRRRIMDMRYTEDFTLGEIAENLGITRQGAHEAVNASITQLEAYERQMHMVERDLVLKRRLTDALNALNSGDVQHAIRVIEDVIGGGGDGV